MKTVTKVCSVGATNRSMCACHKMLSAQISSNLRFIAMETFLLLQCSLIIRCEILIICVCLRKVATALACWDKLLTHTAVDVKTAMSDEMIKISLFKCVIYTHVSRSKQCAICRMMSLLWLTTESTTKHTFFKSPADRMLQYTL